MSVCPQCQRERPLFWTRKGRRCFSCGEGFLLELLPSPRQQKKFSRGFSFAALAEVLLLPLALPGLMMFSLALVWRWKEPFRGKMTLGSLVVVIFWIVLLPPFTENPTLPSALLLSLFASLSLIFLLAPSIVFSRSLLLRGRGAQAGVQLASAFAASSISLLSPLLLLLFL